MSPPLVKATPEQLLAFQQKLERYALVEARESYEESLSEFLEGAWASIDSANFQRCWAIDAMCDHLEAVTLGHIRRLLINLPPRCSKTSVSSIGWPAWTWARSQHSFWSGPKVKFLCGSYNAKLSLESANKERRLLRSPWYQQYWGDRFDITPDQDNKEHFDITTGGSRQSTSVGGSLLGLGGDIIIVDDPHNTETEKVVETDADRNKVASWWRELSGTRLNDPKRSSIVVGMQRLHQGDLSGVILDNTDEEFVHLMIPMEYDSGRHCVTVKLPQYDDDAPWEDPRTEENELMWEERFDHQAVARMKSRLGPYMSSGRLQQAPTPKGGGIIQRDWWQCWDGETAQQYGLQWDAERKEFPPFELVVGSLDTSYGEKQENDYNALTIWGIWLDRAKNRRAMLMFAWKKRLKLSGKDLESFPGEMKVQFQQRQREEFGLVEWVHDTCSRYKVKRLLIENKTRGKDVADELKLRYARENFGVQLLNPVGDKVSRAHATVPLFTDNVVWAPDTRWAEDVIQECSLFPKGDHDDQVDSVTQFLKWARDNGLILRGDEMSAALEDEMTYLQPAQTISQRYGI